jgi:hypothetical protein
MGVAAKCEQCGGTERTCHCTAECTCNCNNGWPCDKHDDGPPLCTCGHIAYYHTGLKEVAGELVMPGQPCWFGECACPSYHAANLT